MQALLAASTGLGLGWLFVQLERRRVRGVKVFDMDPRLLVDKFEVSDLTLCRVLVCNDANYPCWVVLVPRLNRVRELVHLTRDQQRQLWKEVAAVAKVIHALYRPFKVNIATIGNVVPQLHVHVTGRLETDPAWPGPCYGAVPPQPLAPEQLETVVAMLRDALKRVDV